MEQNTCTSTPDPTNPHHNHNHNPNPNPSLNHSQVGHYMVLDVCYNYGTLKRTFTPNRPTTTVT